MLRHCIVLSVGALLSLALTVPSAGQDAPRSSRGWEYGALERTQTGNGTALVFCRFTLDGCDEAVGEAIPLPTAAPKPTVPASVGRYERSVARVIAKLGREGWELVAESSFTRSVDDGPVLLFKRSIGPTNGPR